MRRHTGPVGYVYLFMVYAFLFFPAILVVVFSFNSSRFWMFPLKSFSWRWYEDLLARPQAIRAVENSLIVAVPTVVLAVLIGGCVAIAMHRMRFRGRGALEGALLLPQLIPTLIWSIALLGFVVLLGLPRGAPTIVVGHTLFTVPYVVLLVTTRLHSFDPDLENAARSLGAGTGRFFLKVMLPHLSPALVSSGLIAFAISFSDLVIAFFLAGGGFDTLPIYIYSLIQFEPSPVINAVASIILGTAVLAIVLALVLSGREALIPGSGGRGGPKERRL